MFFGFSILGTLSKLLMSIFKVSKDTCVWEFDFW